MEKRRTRYDHSFKENAVKLSYERKNLSELSRELVIPSNLIYRCRKESEEYGDVVFNGAFNFNDADNEDDEYNYDANGNMTQDLNKGINRIDYNYLNLPVSVTFTNGHITEYIYDATGTKRSVIYKVQPETLFAPLENSVESVATAEPLVVSSRKDYCGNHIYDTYGNLMTVLTDNGYIENGSYHYYVADYQGNNRVVFDRSGNVEQVNHYYPYGGVFTEGIRMSGQQYKFGGKELDRMNGLDMYDFGARQLDSAVPTWTTMDPMAEKYYSISPFAYCAGNPVRYVDPNGKEIWVGNVQYQAGMKYYGKDVFTKSVISALNLIYKSGGGKLVNDLIKSDSKYNYKENNSEKSSYTIQKDNGDVDINIKTDAPVDVMRFIQQWHMKQCTEHNMKTVRVALIYLMKLKLLHLVNLLAIIQ